LIQRAAISGKRCAYRGRVEIETMYAHAEAMINPTRATNIMQRGAFETHRQAAAG
jgi:hypothetical protein